MFIRYRVKHFFRVIGDDSTSFDLLRKFSRKKTFEDEVRRSFRDKRLTNTKASTQFFSPLSTQHLHMCSEARALITWQCQQRRENFHFSLSADKYRFY